MTTNRRISYVAVGGQTPERVLRQTGLHRRADIHDLVAASWDGNQNGYLDEKELSKGAERLDGYAPKSKSIHLDGYRANRGVFYSVKNALIEKLDEPVENAALFDVAKTKDDGNRYLSATEIRAAAKKYPKHKKQKTASQAKERVRFDQPPVAPLAKGAAARDAVFDKVVLEAAKALEAMGHKVTLDGVSANKTEMMSGRIPTMDYGSGFGADFHGEVYNRITVETKKGKRFTASLGMLSSDRRYPGTNKKVHDREIQILNLNDEQLKYTGAGISFSLKFGPGNLQPASLPAVLGKHDEMVKGVVGWFTNLITLNP